MFASCARLLPNVGVLLTLASALLLSQPAEIPTPSQFLGLTLGADRVLASYDQIASYFDALAKSSKRIEIEHLGPTTQGRDLFAAIISSEENLKNKETYKSIARRLADPRGLSAQEIDDLVSKGKAILFVTCNIHSTEIASTQMAMEWAHDLVAAQDQKTSHGLDNVVLILIPSLNPDGQQTVVEWYRKNVGTKYEGGRLPWLYHPYVGHDNNRDWYMLTQKETRAVNHAAYHEWFPQVWLDEHQMGSTGPRLFVPPYTNPVAQNVHPLVWRTVDNIGTFMAWRLEEAQKSGVVYGAMYDTYWPGATEGTACWKNVCGLLTEAASTQMGTPVEVVPGELSGGTKGLVEYTQQANFPNPWRGGIWRLRDIMDYERIASDALLEACAEHRVELLRGIASMALDAVKLSPPDAYYCIPQHQRDPLSAAHLAFLLRENGAEVLFSESESAYFIPKAQPLGRFVNEMLGVQRYPEVKLVAGPNVVPPYDVTAWSLPLMMDVAVERVTLDAGKRNALRPLRDADVPRGSVIHPEARTFAVSRETNASSRLINDQLAEHNSVQLTSADIVVEGKTLAKGAILLNDIKDPSAIAAKYGVHLTGLSEQSRVESGRLLPFRLGMYKPWTASMDEGWTRWLLEQYHFPVKSITTKELKEQKLGTSYDIIILPDLSKEVIAEGKRKPEEGEMKYFVDLPPEYSGGIGKEGAKNLKDFVEQGGTVIALASSCDFVFDEFNIPVVNTLARAKSDDFNCPGSLLRMHVDPSHPVTYGMTSEIAAFVGNRMAFQTVPPAPDITRRVLAWYPDEAKDILLSGWIAGAEKLQRRAAVVVLTYGKGKLVLLGFRVQHRAQTEGTFKLLFNAICWGAMKSNQ
jgi:hypothetical protein